MSDVKRVKKAMQMVARHKLPTCLLMDADFDVFAETAVKTMWLIEEEAICTLRNDSTGKAHVDVP